MSSSPSSPRAPRRTAKLAGRSEPETTIEVVGHQRRLERVRLDVRDPPELLAGGGVVALDPAVRTDDDLASVGRQGRGGPGDSGFAVRLPGVFAGRAVDGEQVGVGHAGQQDDGVVFGQQYRTADAVIAGEAAVVGGEIPVPQAVAVVVRREQVAGAEEEGDPLGVDGGRGGGARRVLVEGQALRGRPAPAPEFLAVGDAHGREPQRVLGLLGVGGHRRHVGGAAPDDRAGVAERRKFDGPGRLGPCQGQGGALDRAGAAVAEARPVRFAVGGGRGGGHRRHGDSQQDRRPGGRGATVGFHLDHGKGICTRTVPFVKDRSGAGLLAGAA